MLLPGQPVLSAGCPHQLFITPKGDWASPFSMKIRQTKHICSTNLEKWLEHPSECKLCPYTPNGSALHKKEQSNKYLIKKNMPQRQL